VSKTADPDDDFEYRKLGEDGHASSDQEQKLRMFWLLADFLDRRVWCTNCGTR